ncbi:oligosaccharyl transferase, archaeosortase A system-associated [Methanoculleus chikugoensis]|uniref:dolichyl-phosphooligosaccharide-protein glycotransferase n=1 Tax=Methanoculleus chikugoensis TaxID=118126 RepID=A0A1M4MLW0_9EURY|nr:oligosaccharyl transferase, archaeosortase A system-associated [Methanoculleus chikugoensis]SCL75931.1 oligosaccharyl transferase, archaeosortase A system-associated [Methanoculleus chikugoensis]
MAQMDLKKYQPYIIIGIIVLFALLTLWTRGIPSEGLVTAEGVNLLGNDPWYKVRQVEQTVANFPGYAWFEVMTLYPTGDNIHWGPLFAQIIATLCLLTGASTRPEIMVVASWVPPLMAVAMVPITYLLAKKIADWKTGLIAAGLIAVIGSNYAYRSLFGFVDHHIAETLFSTIFVLAYVTALLAARDRPLFPMNFENLKIPVITAALAGIAYLLGFFNMPTMVLFALIVAAFTLVQFILDSFEGRSSEYLVLVNAVAFGVAIVGAAAFGFPHPGLGLPLYSVGHVIAYAALIAGTLALYALSVFLKDRPKYYFPAALAAVAALAVAVLYFALPEIYNLLIANLLSFFGTGATTTTVQEARAWSFDAAWATFHWGLVLAAGGAAALLWQNRERVNPAHVFVLIWTAIILASTAAHVRYEYYLAANIALLAAVFAGAVIDATWRDVARLLGRGSGSRASPDPEVPEKQETPVKKGKKGGKAPEARKAKTPRRDQPDYLKVGAFAVVVGVTLIFAGTSLLGNIALANSAKYGGMDSQWMEALEWMGENTPDPGVDYYTIYDQNTFTYPEESYGVMSWWDFGHWITFIAKRIPNNNPFQHGVAGPNGSAVYLVSTDEAAANRILDNIGTRYVITDIEVDTSKFHAPVTWADVGQERFQPYFLLPVSAGSSEYQAVPFNSQEYYLTMISRLHNFDGSMTDPTEASVIYAEYREPAAANTSLPVITRTQQMNATEGAAAVEAYNRNAPAGSGATLLNMYYQYRGDSVLQPLERVPALQHYRLVHETPRNVYGNVGEDGPDLKAVKIFEYVPGATIRGEGIIEVPIVTNTGREFTYRQESVNGTFVVPYATSGWSGEVKATGQYRIAGTGQTFDVTEEDILQGHTIN